MKNKVQVDRFGRILIPKQYRDELGITPGSSLKIEKEGDHLILVQEYETSCLQKEENVLVYTGEAIGSPDDFINAVDKNREDYIKKISGNL